MFPSGSHEGWNLMGAKVHHNSGAIILPFFLGSRTHRGQVKDVRQLRSKVLDGRRTSAVTTHVSIRGSLDDYSSQHLLRAGTRRGLIQEAVREEILLQSCGNNLMSVFIEVNVPLEIGRPFGVGAPHTIH